jgi:hypothetical protein
VTKEEIQSALNLLTALETLDNIKIRDALIACRRDGDTLVFTNQADESFEFNLQNLDVDLLKSTIINSANNFTSNALNHLANNLHENLNAHADNLKVVDSSLQTRIDAVSKDIKSNIKDTSKNLLDKVSKNMLSRKDAEDIVKLLIRKDEAKNLISAAKSSITSKFELQLNTRLETLEASLKGLIENLDYLEDADIENDYLVTFKKGKKQRRKKVGGVHHYYGGGGGGSGEGDFKYTNSEPTPNKIGGIKKGTTFQATPLKNILNLLLYGYDEPYFSTFNVDYASVYEVGYTIQSQNKTAYWGINDTKLLEANSIKITYVNGNILVADNLSNTGSSTFATPSISFNLPTKVDFKISAMSSTETELSDMFSFNFKHRIYVGHSDLSVLTADTVKTLQLTDLVDTIDGKYPVDEGGYKWICYPKYFGLKRCFKDFASDIDIEMEDPITLMITNAYGLNIEYYCHRSYYKLGSAMEIVVS